MATLALSSHQTQKVSAPALPGVPALQRPPGAKVPVDLAISLTSQELYTVTARRELQPGGCIAVSPAGATLALGSQARQMEGRVPPHVRVLQPLQNGRVHDSQLAVRVLEHAFREAGFRGPVGPRVLLQVPGSLTESERRSLTEAARAAGARSVVMVDQARVAAAGAELPLLEPRASLMVHLDATSAEASVISFGRVIASRPLSASWQNWQTAVCDLVRRDFQVQISMSTAETLLLEVGAAVAQQETSCWVGGRDLARGLPRKIEVSSSCVLQAISPSLDHLARELQALVISTSHELLSDLVESGVVLAGPGASLKGLAGFLSGRVNLAVRSHPEGEGLLRVMRDQNLRRSLLGTHTRRRAGWKPTQLAAAAVLMLGLGGSALSLAPGGAAENPLQASMAPLWKAIAPPVVAARGDGLSQEERRRQQQMSSENQRLRSLIKLRGAPYASGGVLGARVLTHQPSGWPGMLVLDSGAAQGVKTAMPVVNAEGLVGTVSSVTQDSSRVRLLTHPNTVISARVGRSQAKGVLYGRNQKLCELRFLDPENKVHRGDVVYTSGLDGRYPAGIRLGKVVGLSPQKAVYSSVLVQPANPDDSTEVLALRR